MKTTKTILVEDEVKNMELLLHFIKKYCPSLEVVATCLTFADAVKTLNKVEADLVFLDILLDENTSFDLLETINHTNFQIIFTTAFDEYAIQAFKYNTVDYLLKPVVIEQLVDAVTRAEERIEQKSTANQGEIQQLSRRLIGRNPFNLLVISGMNKVDFIRQDEIIYLKSAGRYTEFHFNDANRQVLATKPIGEFENALDHVKFYRIHNSYIINLSQLVKINKVSGNYCEMANGDNLPISRRRLEGLLRYFKELDNI